MLILQTVFMDLPTTLFHLLDTQDFQFHVPFPLRITLTSPYKFTSHPPSMPLTPSTQLHQRLNSLPVFGSWQFNQSTWVRVLSRVCTHIKSCYQGVTLCTELTFSSRQHLTVIYEVMTWVNFLNGLCGTFYDDGTRAVYIQDMTHLSSHTFYWVSDFYSSCLLTKLNLTAPFCDFTLSSPHVDFHLTYPITVLFISVFNLSISRFTYLMHWLNIMKNLYYIYVTNWM